MVSTRRFSFGPMSPTAVVVVTLIVLAVAYVAQCIAVSFFPDTAGVAVDKLGLDYNAVMRGEAWRLLSYGALHDTKNPTHLLLNGFMFYMFGRDLEQRYGRARFIGFFTGAVAIGGVFVVVGRLIGLSSGYAIGFSAAVEACCVLWALLNKNAQVMFFFFPMRGIHMLWIGLVMWLLDAVSQSPVSASAHLGGIVFGAVVWFFSTRRNHVRLFVDDVLSKLRIRKQPKLTVVPKNDRWVN